MYVSPLIILAIVGWSIVVVVILVFSALVYREIAPSWSDIFCLFLAAYFVARYLMLIY